MTIKDNLLESVGEVAGKPFQKWGRDSNLSEGRNELTVGDLVKGFGQVEED